MKLSHVLLGDNFAISSLHMLDKHMRYRMLSLGVMQGQIFEVVNKQRNGNMVIQAVGEKPIRIALGKEVANMVIVCSNN